MFDLIIENGTCVLPQQTTPMDIGVTSGKIAAIGKLNDQPAKKRIDATGLHILPGVIDTQVHFREPGLEHKEDLESGTRAAILGGVTGVFEMPNTKPPTTSQEALNDKLNRARSRAWCNYAFYIGATSDNLNELPKLEKLKGVCGIKIFMGSSTGNLLLDRDEWIENVLKNGTRPVAIHAEDEALLKLKKTQIPKNAGPEYHPVWRDAEVALTATKKIVQMAEKFKRQVHVLHISSKEEMEFLRDKNRYVSVETLPQFLVFSGPDVYRKIGTKAQMNPPIRYEEDRTAVWTALKDGVVDVLGTDHAPHTLEEKSKPYPESPSGMPGVQTLVPVMLTQVQQGRLSLEKFSQLTSQNPAKIFGIKNKGKVELGYDADFTVVDLQKTKVIRNADMATKSGWTPFDGFESRGWPTHTIIGGVVVMENDKVVGTPQGQALEFLS